MWKIPAFCDGKMLPIIVTNVDGTLLKNTDCKSVYYF